MNAGDAIVMGVENSVFAYGGSFGDYANFKVTGQLNSAKSVKALRGLSQALYLQPAGLGNAFFVETNTAFAQGRWRWR